MILGALIAIRDFVLNESGNKLLVVGNLLVYVHERTKKEQKRTGTAIS
jgi:hypothetical protein